MMREKKKQRKLFSLSTLLIFFMLAGTALPAAAGETDDSGLITWDLDTGLTAENLVSYIQGPGITVSSAAYTGANCAVGKFSGGDGIIGFEKGIILSSGDIALVKGPNSDIPVHGKNNTLGDPELDLLAGNKTYDAAVLEFDFIPVGDKITMQYVFASEEYNQSIGLMFNDVFAFFVNGVNYATLGEGEDKVPVSINSINNGKRYQKIIPPSNPEFYINNDPYYCDYFGYVVKEEDLLNTSMDGLTIVLTMEAPVKKGETNTMKLAIADVFDRNYDSNLFIKAGSLTSEDTNYSISPPEDTTSKIRGQGFWKNHVEKWPEELSDSIFHLSEQTWLEVLHTPVRGNAYYILARKYIPAYLNIINGCTLPDAVQEAFDSATEFFANFPPDALAVKNNKKTSEQDINRKEILEWAAILGSWDNSK